MKSRYLYQVLASKSNSRFGRIIVLTGARQTGKTTLAQKVFPHYTYINVEDPITRSSYSNLTAAQWNILYPNAILDEVQKVPSLIESVKAVYDGFDVPRYVLLGSSQILLLDKVKESLAGRCLIYEVFPLTIPETLSGSWDEEIQPSFFQKFISTNSLSALPSSFLITDRYAESQKAFDHYLEYGGYPVLANDEVSHEEKRQWLHNYTRTYLERDIRDLVQLRDLESFVRIQKTAAMMTGCMMNYAHLAKEARISHPTAQRFLTYMEISQQIILLQPWFRNKLKRLNKSPKIHFLDPGVHRAILRKEGQLSGFEYESAIISEIYKQSKQLPVGIDIYHLRTVDGREIDLLIELENGYIAIEIKLSQRVTSTDAKHLGDLDSILDKPLLQSFVVSNDPDIKEIKKNVLAMPAAMFVS